MSRTTTCLVAGVLSALLCAASAFAQVVTPPAPPPGMFGGVRANPAVRSQLDLTAAIVQGHDSDVPAQLQPAIDPSNLESGGFSTTVNAAAAYSFKKPRVQLGANATSVVRYYADLREARSIGHSAGIGLTTRMSERTSLTANQSAAYAPTFFSGLFPTGATLAPGNAGTTAPDYSISRFESYTYSTNASLRQDLTNRTHVSVSGEYVYTDRLHENAQWQDVSAHAMRAQYSTSFRRRTAFTAQYRYRSGEFGYTAGTRTTEQGFDAGLSYTRPLSATRTLTLHFNAGASAADIPRVGQQGEVIQRQYLATTEGGLEYALTRTWRARASFRRGFEYVVDIPEPVFANGATAGVEGALARRIDVSMQAGYSSGASALNRDAMTFDSYTGDLRLRYALTPKAATYVEYLYYFYDFRGSIQLLPGIPPGLERNGIRVGVMFWVPALRR